MRKAWGNNKNFKSSSDHPSSSHLVAYRLRHLGVKNIGHLWKQEAWSIICSGKSWQLICILLGCISLLWFVWFKKSRGLSQPMDRTIVLLRSLHTLQTAHSSSCHLPAVRVLKSWWTSHDVMCTDHSHRSCKWRSLTPFFRHHDENIRRTSNHVHQQGNRRSNTFVQLWTYYMKLNWWWS